MIMELLVIWPQGGSIVQSLASAGVGVLLFSQTMNFQSLADFKADFIVSVF